MNCINKQIYYLISLNFPPKLIFWCLVSLLNNMFVLNEATRQNGEFSRSTTSRNNSRWTKNIVYFIIILCYIEENLCDVSSRSELHTILLQWTSQISMAFVRPVNVESSRGSSRKLTVLLYGMAAAFYPRDRLAAVVSALSGQAGSV